MAASYQVGEGQLVGEEKKGIAGRGRRERTVGKRRDS